MDNPKHLSEADKIAQLSQNLEIAITQGELPQIVVATKSIFASMTEPDAVGLIMGTIDKIARSNMQSGDASDSQL